VPRLRSLSSIALVAVVLTLVGCDSPGEVPVAEEQAHPVALPFEIRDGADDLLFTYVDDTGPHTVGRLEEVPPAHRAQVAVRSLSIAPEARPDPDQVFVVDLRTRGEDGRYPALLMSRDAFDRLADEAAGVASPDARGQMPGSALGPEEVVIYGASWCGACRSAAAFLRSEGVPFVEKDIERDAAAREEMTSKLRALGMEPGSIPVIDFRGTIVRGFDRPRLEALIGEPAQPI